MLTKATDYSNLYRAKVVSNYDPKELCRIKARIPCIHGVSEIDGISDDAIPYASPCFLDASFDSGTFLVPEVGSTVFIFFESGESTKPIYFPFAISKPLFLAEETPAFFLSITIILSSIF